MLPDALRVRLSLPGAATQGIHRDGKHIFLETEADAAYGEDDANDDDVNRIRRAGAISSWSSSSPPPSFSSVQYSKLPAHCITVFVPLVDLCGGGGGNGPTEFWPGTHHTTADEPSPLASSVTFTDQDDDDEENVEGEDEGEGRSTANGAAGSGGIDIDIDVDDDDDVAPVVIAGGSGSSSSSSSGVDIDDVDDIPATNVSSEPRRLLVLALRTPQRRRDGATTRRQVMRSFSTTAFCTAASPMAPQTTGH